MGAEGLQVTETEEGGGQAAGDPMPVPSGREVEQYQSSLHPVISPTDVAPINSIQINT